MCGIIAVLRRRAQRTPPSRDELTRALARALADTPSPEDPELGPLLFRIADDLEAIDRALRGPAGTACLLAAPDLAARIGSELRAFEARVDSLEAALDRGEHVFSASVLEGINSGIVRVRDASWALRRDRVGAASAVADLAGTSRGTAALEAFAAIQTALAALDRLEVRGRDSAGLHVLVKDHGLDLRSRGLAAEISSRGRDPLFRNGSVRVAAGRLCFVYKRAAEIGELGDNVAALRQSIRNDELLHKALAAQDAEVTVLGHTRWASVGIISEANAHPLNQEETDGAERPYSIAVLNGDVDNHESLTREHGLEAAAEITTDAKVIPCLVARRLAAGDALVDAFRRTVSAFDGSVAIALGTADAPDELVFALRGSGQAMYVGLAEDAFVVASEPYGVVEETDRYLRMDGDTPGNPADPVQSRGQIVHLTRTDAGTLSGLRRLAYDGTELPVDERSLTRASITTRDVDRGDFRHFLLKEISEAPRSFQKTLRGKLVERRGRLSVTLGETTLPDRIGSALSSGKIRRIVTIGQGTAAVAAQGVAAALELALRESRISIATRPATELSGFHLREDMSDTLVVAISQSGTTTDTNRTVDLVRARGAFVLAIVNRRGSDLTDKADGVLYTSDGRDVEMSVASTKAFYAQIAAGFVLAFGLAQRAGIGDGAMEHELLQALRELPEAMTATLERRAAIAEAARALAPGRRHWAVVGNGRNRIAAEEIRIKLSELCYKSIACDATEDKKHIDLSSEPLILVCAAGLRGSTATDVAKEVAIYKAHKALPIVIAEDGETRFTAASRVLYVPRVHPELGFVLAAVVGHLLGYEAALAIDALATPLREARAAIERLTHTRSDGEGLLQALAPELVLHADAFASNLRAGRLDGQLEASTAVRLASLFRYATGTAPLEYYQIEHGKVGTPATVVDDLIAALTRATDELTRPVDAIKHQAKTVTVGISRSDEALLSVPLVRDLLDAGVPRERLTYGDLRTLGALAPTVQSVTGWSRYRIEGDGEQTTIQQIGSSGSAQGLRSRTLTNPTLRGTKHQVARERQLLVAKGRSDGRVVILVPEVLGNVTTGMTLLHVTLHDRVDVGSARTALMTYRNRYSTLVDSVLETEPAFADERLATLPVLRLLTEPVHVLAESWRAATA
jgi:glucosamine--fructose-6-phosphate aminotransferase (isomerizing)